MFALMAAPALAQSPSKAAAATLASVSVSGSARFAGSQIAAATGLHPGDAVSRESLQAAADRLARLGTFSNVQYRFMSDDAGVKVEYQVVDAVALPVVFDNLPQFSDEELGAALKSAVILYDGTAPESGSLLDGMSDALAKLLKTRGIDASVSHTVTNEPDSGQRVMEFALSGTLMRVEEIQFSDTLANTDPSIRTRLSDVVGKPYSRSALLSFESEQVRPVYLEHAHLRVKFGPPSIRLTGDPTKPQLDKIIVVAPIDPGPAYAWGGVEWTGNTVVPTEALDRLVEFKRGEIADGIRIATLWIHAHELFTKIGYLDSTLTFTPHYEDAAAQVSYSVSVFEGPQYHMGQLVLTGLSVEGERRIRNAWNIPRGAIFSRSVYEHFLQEGVQQALKGLPAHYEKIGPFLQRDPKTAVVDVLLDFQ